jgi:hypothetical protein
VPEKAISGRPVVPLGAAREDTTAACSPGLLVDHRLARHREQRLPRLVPLGQGFHLGRPVPVERALADAASR